jgi:hypothetical protein
MVKNVGSADRIIRAILGIALIALALMGTSAFIMNYKVIVAAVGVIVLFTAVVAWCPAYLAFGINTLGKK